MENNVPSKKKKKKTYGGCRIPKQKDTKTKIINIFPEFS